METDNLLTVPDVAARLRVREETVREWLRTAQLHGYNLGGQAGWRIPEAEITRLLESRGSKQRDTPAAPAEQP